jgi:hypothetical protein
MASEKRILKSAGGVTLTEVALRSGSAISALAYTVRSKRTPEAPNFDNLPAAELAFRDEVARCAA